MLTQHSINIFQLFLFPNWISWFLISPPLFLHFLLSFSFKLQLMILSLDCRAINISSSPNSYLRRRKILTRTVITVYTCHMQPGHLCHHENSGIFFGCVFVQYERWTFIGWLMTRVTSVQKQDSMIPLVSIEFSVLFD